MTELKNIINGVECCWRCSMSREDVKRTQHGCNVWGTSYPHHLWSALTGATNINETKVLVGQTSNKCGHCGQRGHSAQTCDLAGNAQPV